MPVLVAERDLFHFFFFKRLNTEPSIQKRPLDGVEVVCLKWMVEFYIDKILLLHLVFSGVFRIRGCFSYWKLKGNLRHKNLQNTRQNLINDFSCVSGDQFTIGLDGCGRFCMDDQLACPVFLDFGFVDVFPRLGFG